MVQVLHNYDLKHLKNVMYMYMYDWCTAYYNHTITLKNITLHYNLSLDVYPTHKVIYLNIVLIALHSPAPTPASVVPPLHPAVHSLPIPTHLERNWFTH